MTVLFAIFLVLHVATAAAFFGLGLPLARLGRTAVAASGEASAVLLAQGSRTVATMGALLAATFFLAFGALFANGGFATYGAPYHTSITLLLVMLGVHFGLVAPAWRALSGGNAQGALGRLAAGVGVTHLLWLVILVLMFWNRIGPAL